MEERSVGVKRDCGYCDVTCWIFELILGSLELFFEGREFGGWRLLLFYQSFEFVELLE